ncbi:MAG: DUF1501 domain-containing protein [Bdellovibrionales bacterium]|nr:DUF1501 domain-containing protein [Bdellovibrionales bacterium]
MKRREFVVQMGKSLSLVVASKAILTQAAWAKSKNLLSAAARRMQLNAWSSRHLSHFSLANEAQGPGHFLVLYELGEGADTLAGLDPRIHQKGEDEKDFFIPYRSEERIRFGESFLGPAASPLMPHLADIGVVNGIMMYRDVGHESLSNFLASGNPSGMNPRMSSALSFCEHRGHGGVMVNGTSDPSPSPVQQTSLFDLSNGSLIQDYQQIKDSILEEDGSSNDYFSELVKKLGVVASAADQMSRIKSQIDAQNPGIRSEHAWLAAAFASGFSMQANLLPNSDAPTLDSHSNYEADHATAQVASWQYLADIMTLFKKVPYGSGSLFDHTTFMAYNEFSRTPYLNAAAGKDHNPLTNSVLLAGKGVQGGVVVGESQIITRGKSVVNEALHIAKPFDFESQSAVAAAGKGQKFIDPTNVAATIAQIFKNSLAPGSFFEPVAASVPYLKKILKS